MPDDRPSLNLPRFEAPPLPAWVTRSTDATTPPAPPMPVPSFVPRPNTWFGTAHMRAPGAYVSPAPSPQYRPQYPPHAAVAVPATPPAPVFAPTDPAPLMPATADTAPVAPDLTDAPVRGRERIVELDLLRGLALLGILLMNIEFPAGWMYRGETSSLSVVLDIAAEAKFISLFAMLFGFGFAVQMRRGTTARYLRRTIGLLVIGVLHATFLFSGDILVSYAVIGIALLAFRNARPRTLLVWAGGLMVVGAVALLAMVAGVTDDFSADGKATLMQNLGAYAEGSFLDVARARWRESVQTWSIMPFMAPQLLALFLLGMAACRSQILDPAPGNERLLRAGRNWGLALGMPLAIWAGWTAHTSADIGAATQAAMWNIILAPLLTIGYACLAILLYRAGSFSSLAGHVSNAGRMALTNYLGQSVICSLLFCGYGLGFFASVAYPLLVIVALAIYVGQVAFSNWWLSQYELGPVEWALRSVTYGKAQPLRRRSTPPQAVSSASRPA